MGPAAATLRCLLHPFDLSGRAGRTEWWGFVLGLMTAGLVGGLALAGLTDGRVAEAGALILGRLPAALPLDAASLPYVGAALAGWVALAVLAALVRRLHDVDRSGWWVLALAVPVLGAAWLVLLTARRGTRGFNRFDAPADAPANAVAAPSMPRRPTQRRRAKPVRPSRDRKEIVSLYDRRMPTLPRRPAAMAA